MFEIADYQGSIEAATAFAIAYAKERGAEEVTPDDILLGCLRAVSRFGVFEFGSVVVDLEPLGVNWLKDPEKSRAKVSYSEGAVRVLDLAAMIARSDGARKVGVDHLLAAFAKEQNGVAAKIRRTHRITSGMWRAAAAHVARDMGSEPAAAAQSEAAATREYLSPEDAALELGIHVQTVRAYVRSGKLPALRLAGERAIRIRRSDLPKLLEPVQAD